MKESRQEIIKEMFRTKGEVKLRELEERFPQCSSMTLRRDIISLEEQGLVKRTRGGAVAMSKIMIVTEDVYHKRASINTEKKLEIAKKAAALFTQGCSIFIDAGSTMMFFERELPDEYCSILTTGVNVALELMKKKNPIVTIVGGQLNKSSFAVTGINTGNMLDDMNIDVAFLASTGCTFDSGFTCGTYTDCELKRRMVHKARRTIILMDSTKLGKNMPFTFANIDEVDVVVSDSQIPRDVVRQFESRGITVL